jgi:DASH complex subunit DAM1
MTERDALAAMEAMQQAKAAAAAAREAELTKTMEQTDMDITYGGLTTTNATNASVPSKSGVKKKPGKPKLTAKEKKERSVRLSSTVFKPKSITRVPLV